MLTSIIIPVKNEEKCLPILLESLKYQGLMPGELEVRVADAGSTDRTVEIAEDYGCIVVRGGMPAVGRNNGAKAAKGEILVFKDADSHLMPYTIELGLREMNERGLDVAGTLHYPLSSKKGFAALRYKAYVEFFSNRTIAAAEHANSPLMMNCMFARRKVHEAIGGFDETLEFGEDNEYAKRAKKAGYKFGILRYCGKVGFNMRKAEESFLKELKWLGINFYFTTGRRFGHEFVRDKSVVRYWDKNQ